ncbi:hypothetical protein O6H91_07G047300 [Diphasiastrum complanatum]|uniref:Uncharacterized protein n=1 Tax=Diphasiastrum complanatum TaxID=34168 RepID=A0ACC2D5N0_DIPCM|nr:hypothetical protein O6H91_07G047300 [Diphasiastrum complanatum]
MLACIAQGFILRCGHRFASRPTVLLNRALLDCVAYRFAIHCFAHHSSCARTIIPIATNADRSGLTRMLKTRSLQTNALCSACTRGYKIDSTNILFKYHATHNLNKSHSI